MRFKRDFLRQPSLEGTFFAPLFLKSPGKLLIRDKDSLSPPDQRCLLLCRLDLRGDQLPTVGIPRGLASARKEPTLKGMIDSLAFSM